MREPEDQDTINEILSLARLLRPDELERLKQQLIQEFPEVENYLLFGEPH